MSSNGTFSSLEGSRWIRNQWGAPGKRAEIREVSHPGRSAHSSAKRNSLSRQPGSSDDAANSVRVLALLLLGVVVAGTTQCTQTNYLLAEGGTGGASLGTPEGGGAAGSSVAGSSAAGAGALNDTLGPFSTPVLVAELSAAGAFDDDPSLTSDLTEIFFNSNRAGGNGGSDIWTARRNSSEDPWGTPELVEELSTTAVETRVSVLADGLTIYLSSGRPNGIGGLDVWRSQRSSRSDPWSDPEHVWGLSSASDDLVATTGGESGLLFVARYTTDTESYDLYSFRDLGTDWGPAVPLVALNTAAYESDPFLAADNLTLFFARDGDSTERSDLFVTTRSDPTQPFGLPEPVAGLNTIWNESDLWVSPDQRIAYFASDRDGGLDIYEARR